MKTFLACGMMVIGLIWAGHGTAAAELRNHQFKISNRSGLYITEIRVSEGNSKRWKSDILGQDALGDDESVSIDFEYAPGTCVRSLKIVYGDRDESSRNNGKYDVFEKVDLCRLRTLTIGVDDTASKTVPSWEFESR